MKDFLKSNLAAIITVLLLFGGLSAFAVVTDITQPDTNTQDTSTPSTTQPSTEVQQVKPIGVFNSNGDLINVKKEVPSKDNLSAQTGETTLILTEEEFQLTQTLGMGRFKNEGGKLVEKPNPKGNEFKYVVFFNPADGVITDVKEKTGTETGDFIEIPDVRYNQIMQDGKDKYRISGGEVARYYENSTLPNYELVEDANGKVTIPPELQGQAITIRDSNGNITGLIPPNVH